MECSKHTWSGEHRYLPLQSLPVCHLWPRLKSQIPFSLFLFQKNNRIQHKLMFCCHKNTSALGVPARYQGAAGETGAAPSQEQVMPVSSNQPTAGPSWVLQPPWRVPQESVFQKGQKMPVDQQGIRDKRVRNISGNAQVIPEGGKLCHLHWGRIPREAQPEQVDMTAYLHSLKAPLH